MPDILHDLPIRAPKPVVFRAVSTSSGLDTWWTETSDGAPGLHAEYVLRFGPDYTWRARVTEYAPDARFELELFDADTDWVGTRVGFALEDRDKSTWLRFHHTGWPQSNEHYRISCNCWAMYLRVLRRSLEHGEAVPYSRRLDV